MAEELHIDTTAGKEAIYQSLLPQLDALVEGEDDLIANLSNLMAALRSAFGFFWVGVYRVSGNELVLGPFQGSIACTRIAKGKGVCGACWEKEVSIIVPDVDAFPGHIACSSLSRSEIVIPVKNAKNELVMILDVDSDRLNDFDETDRIYLEKVAALIGKMC
ncbi:MAG: GAF domain-containing protein [Flavobacteriales bacterium]